MMIKTYSKILLVFIILMSDYFSIRESFNLINYNSDFAVALGLFFLILTTLVNIQISIFLFKRKLKTK